MNKKGVELTLQTIGIAILVLLVVAILAMVFSQGIRDGIMQIIGFSKQADADSCVNVFSNRRCLTSDKCLLPNNVVSGEWSDCKNGKVCCE